jgi:hypothetical protein
VNAVELANSTSFSLGYLLMSGVSRKAAGNSRFRKPAEASDDARRTTATATVLIEERQQLAPRSAPP